MKKIFSTLAISSLLIPTFAFAVEGEVRVQVNENIRPRPVLYLNDATSTKRPTEEKKEMRQELRVNASSSARLRAASTTKELGFCAQMDKIVVNIGNGAVTSGEKRVENGEKKDEKREEKRSSIDERREDNTTKRKDQLEELTKRATTDAQKAAVVAFTVSIDKAIAVRKSAIDKVLLTHRTDVDTMIAQRRTLAEKALATLKSDIEKAKAKATTDCSNNVSGDTVRTNLRDSIQKAQLTYRINMRSLQNEVPTSKIEARKAELKKIESEFKTSVEQAKKDLKASFKVQASVAATTTVNSQ
jgi:hypothetical protein